VLKKLKQKSYRYFFRFVEHRWDRNCSKPREKCAGNADAGIATSFTEILARVNQATLGAINF